MVSFVVMLVCIGPKFSSGNGQNQEFLASKASKWLMYLAWLILLDFQFQLPSCSQKLLMHGLLAVVNLVAVFFVVDASHSSA